MIYVHFEKIWYNIMIKGGKIPFDHHIILFKRNITILQVIIRGYSRYEDNHKIRACH